jgi:hypothetical protein
LPISKSHFSVIGSSSNRTDFHSLVPRKTFSRK